MNFDKAIINYKPFNEQEEKDKEIILNCLDKFDNLYNRENRLAHLTSSGFVVNKERDKVLMIYHNIYDSWAWTGGHADGEKDLLYVAEKEVKEETGVKNIKPVIEDIFSLDIIPVMGHIKNEEYVSTHLHLSVTYLIEADENDPLSIKPDENSGVKWIPIKKIADYSTEPDMIEIYNKIVSKMELLKNN